MLPFAKFRRKNRLFQRKKLTCVQALTSANIHARSRLHHRYLFLKNALKLSLLGESHSNGMFQKVRHRVFGFKTQPNEVRCIFLAMPAGKQSRFRMKSHDKSGILLAIFDSTQEPFHGWATCIAKAQLNVEMSRIQDDAESAQTYRRKDGDCINLQSVDYESAYEVCRQQRRSVKIQKYRKARKLRNYHTVQSFKKMASYIPSPCDIVDKAG
jgi:hypothetical protein